MGNAGVPGPSPQSASGPAGYLYGVTQGYRWEAYLARGPVNHGLDPVTLYKGRGRIVSLVLYKPLGRSGIWQKIAVYKRGWQFGRKPYLGVIKAAAAAANGRRQSY